MDETKANEINNNAQVIHFPEPVTAENFREFPEMLEAISDEGNRLRVRTHADFTGNLGSIIDPENANNGLILHSPEFESSTTLLLQNNPYSGFTVHKRGNAVVILKIPREFLDPGEDVEKEKRSGVKRARKEILMDKLPKVIENGKEYPKLPIETIYGVLIGESDITDVFMRFNSLILNPHFAPDKLLEIIRREHPDYDPNKIVESLGRVGGMWVQK